MINGFQAAGMYLQAGIFGLGPNSSLSQWTGRVDLSYQLMWQLDAFGVGNLARIKEQRGEESRAIVELYRTQDRVAADVTRAHANLQSAALRVIQADRALRTGHHHLQRQLRGAPADHPLRRRPGPGLPAAGSGLRPRAAEHRLQRVLHHGRRLQPAPSSSCSTPWATRPPRSRSSTPPARSCRSDTGTAPVSAQGGQWTAAGDPMIGRTPIVLAGSGGPGGPPGRFCAFEANQIGLPT